MASSQGSWAFIMYDADTEYFLAARSACGSHPLFWGTAKTNEDLVLVSSVQDGLTDFPAGCCFKVTHQFRADALHPPHSEGTQLK